MNVDDAKLVASERGNLFSYCDKCVVINNDELGLTKYKVALAVQSPNSLNSIIVCMRILTAAALASSFALSCGYYPARLAYDIAHGVR